MKTYKIMKNKRFWMSWSRGKMTIPIVCGLALWVLFPSFLHAEPKSAHSKEWLGSYVGSRIPGYEVKKSSLVGISGWQSADQMVKADAKRPLAAELEDICIESRDGGIGLINIRSTLALGPVPGPRNAPNSIISNGMYKELVADCVNEAVPLAR